MSYAGLLDHTVTIKRRQEVGETAYGLADTVDVEVATVRAAIQPKSGREVAAYHQAGVAIADHTIFVEVTDLSTSDYIDHVEADCPKPEGHDLPDQRFEPTMVRNAVGRGHHIEVDARLTQPAISGI